MAEIVLYILCFVVGGAVGASVLMRLVLRRLEKEVEKLKQDTENELVGTFERIARETREKKGQNG